ncbi:MAG: hypothetical protein QF535_23765 [Anaerolineales bacterium]|nr:hypothetical protein [Anaerolineales bacterium]
MITILVPLTAINTAHRSVDSDAPQMVFPYQGKEINDPRGSFYLDEIE